MILPVLRSGAALFAVAIVTCGASAQTSNYRSASAEAGKSVRIATVTPLKADCSVGELGGVRVVTSPKNGTLTLKRGKLKTPATFRCPNVETMVEGVFYQSKPAFTGTDEIVYETKSGSGQIARFTVQITVSNKPVTTEPKKDLQDL